ncbi:MAG: HD domain-containing protein [Clostridia bacterium]|nr:HD domain-containing protein [Clostridia bacterium]
MKLDFVRKPIKKYIQEEIKPLYKTFDKAHNLSHFKFVTENCITYAQELINQGYDINLEIAYLVGALHDIGIVHGREGHAKNSANMVRLDKTLPSFFSRKEIELIAEAVEDHSSHLSYEPRSIYGKIVADADRNNTTYLVFSRPIKFGLKHETFRTRQGHIDRVYEFVQDKFGRNGYVKYWLNIPQTTQSQQEVWNLLDNEEKCKSYIAGIFDELTKGKLN